MKRFGKNLMRAAVCAAGIALLFGITACKQFLADIEEELGYWAAEVIVADYSFDKPYQTSNDGALCIPSSVPVTLTIKLRNPKNFSLVMPTSSDDAGKVINFPGLTTQPEFGTDYTFKQTGDMLELTYKDTFLKAHEWSNGNIGPEITLMSTDGRRFGKKFSLNIEANTPPPEIGDITIAKTQTGGYYALCFDETGGMAPMLNGKRLHKDIKAIHIQKEGGSVTIPLTVKEDGAGFYIPSTLPDGLLSSVDTIFGTPPSPGSWTVYIKTDTELAASDALPKKYTVRLIDEKGLSSAPKEAKTLGSIPDISGTNTAWKNLKQAVADAQEGGVITVMGNVTATSDPYNNGAIDVTKSLTIKSKNGAELDASQSTLGTNAHRIFTVTGDKTELTLENLTLKNGKANPGGSTDYGRGGAIYAVRIKTLTLKNCVIEDCIAYGGGGIYLNGGVEAVLESCTITGCTATADPGGAIYAGDSPGKQPIVRIKGGLIKNNTGHISGGAINISRGSLYIEKYENNNAKIENNTVIASGGGGNGGGGIDCYWDPDKSGELIIKDAEIKECKIKYAPSPADGTGRGAGISVYGNGKVSLSKVTLSQCRFIGETAADKFTIKQGGGICLRKVSTATIEGCTFTQCKAKHGGAFHIEGNERGNATVANCTFTQNEAEEYGGALCIDGDAYTVSITGSTIGGVLPQNGNKVTDPSVQYGGGICVFHGLCIVKNVTIQNNTAHKGSGIYLNGKNASGGGLTIDGKATIKDNHLMISYQDTASNFITVKDLDAASDIKIQPENYDDQMNKPLVKAAGTKPDNWETLFNLEVMPSGQTWKLKKNDAGTELILEKTG